MLKLRIKTIRKKRGYTLDVLAERARVSKSLLSEIENHKSTVNTIRLESIAAALDVDPRELIDVGDSTSATEPPRTQFRSQPMWVSHAGAGATDAGGRPAIATTLEDGEGEIAEFLIPEGVARIYHDRIGRSLDDLADLEKKRQSALSS